MNAVTVSTRIGSSNCEDAPDAGVLIQSPNGEQVVMNINGADVSLGSTAFVTTNQDTQRMTFAVLEGTGVVSAFGVSQTVIPGMKTGVQLGGGPDGLQASGPPNEPAPYDANSVAHLPMNLLDRQVEVPPPLDVTQAAPQATTPAPQTGCTPRSDWQYRYVIQRGDNLSIIASKLNVRTADLQAGNCIDNPNLLIAGQTILVPVPVPTNTPLPTATPTLTPTTVGIIGPNFRADSTNITYGDCTYVRWDVDNIKEVYFEGQPVVGHDSRQVCPTETTTYTLLVVLMDNSQQTFTVTVNVSTIGPTCGNDICEPGEDSNTCPDDCYIIS
jgi:LysM repeat protein